MNVKHGHVMGQSASMWIMITAVTLLATTLVGVTGYPPTCNKYSTFVKDMKCQYLSAMNKPMKDCSKLSPCFGGDQAHGDGTQSLITSFYQRLTAQLRAGPERRKRAIYNFDSSPQKKWALPINYLFSTTYNQAQYQSVVRQAFSLIERETCLRFNEVTSAQAAALNDSYISFNIGDGCVSFFGKSANPPDSPIYVTQDCASKFGEMLYYISLTLGMWRQDQRPDASDYLTVNITNLQDPHKGDFGPVPATVQQLYGLPYDLASLLNFPPKVYSSNGEITLQTVDPLYQRTIGQRVELSFLDTKLFNLAYCPNVCAGVTLGKPCSNGGYQHPNACSRCRCPDGYGGDFCDQIAPPLGAQCGGEIILAGIREEVITSPGYVTPGYYPADNIYCTWRIRAPVNSKIRMQFVEDFAIYSENFACYHWAEVRYDTARLNETGPRFCGTVRPDTILQSKGNEALVVFRANFSGPSNADRRGFKMAFGIVSDGSQTCSNLVNQCMNGGTCSNGTCLCPSGFSGPTCQTITGSVGCLPLCLNGGTCVNGTCACPSGYTGPACQNVNTSSSVVTSTTVVTPTRVISSTTFVTPTACIPNPCFNNGSCSLIRGAVTCTCPSPFYGQYCQIAGCGGCSSSPGVLQSKCTVLEQPTRTCNKTVLGCDPYYYRGRFYGCPPYTSKTQFYSCYYETCCNNSVEYLGKCVAGGWGEWSACTVSCGGGFQIRYKYDIVTQPNGLRLANVTQNETSTTPCNTQVCRCPNMEVKRCSFQYSNGKCQPPPPFDQSTPYCYKQDNCRVVGGSGRKGRRGSSSDSSDYSG